MNQSFDRFGMVHVSWLETWLAPRRHSRKSARRWVWALFWWKTLFTHKQITNMRQKFEHNIIALLFSLRNWFLTLLEKKITCSAFATYVDSSHPSRKLEFNPIVAPMFTWWSEAYHIFRNTPFIFLAFFPGGVASLAWSNSILSNNQHWISHSMVLEWFMCHGSEHGSRFDAKPGNFGAAPSPLARSAPPWPCHEKWILGH